MFATVILALLCYALPETATSPALLPARIDGSSVYSSVLTFTHPHFTSSSHQPTQHFYYETIDVNVPITGVYTFTSKSLINIHAYVYDGDDFSPLDPTVKLIAQSNEQGQLTVELEANRPYTLVVAASDLEPIGEFSIFSSAVPRRERRDVVMSTAISSTGYPSTMTTSRSTTPMTTPSASYFGYLAPGSPTFTRPGQSSGNYYYQALRIIISATGSYTFTSAATAAVDMFGVLYTYPFDPSSPRSNMIASDDDSAGGGQFRITQTLQYGQTYVLVVTTFGSLTSASYSIRSSGSGAITLTPFDPPTTRTTTVTTATLPSSYTSGYLSSSSSVFYRYGGSSSSYYYYQAIRLTIYASDYYTFTSASSTDLYGYLYYSSFDPSYPSSSMITSDDDGAGGGQFRLRAYLASGQSYVLVVTTYSSQTSASYSISSSGPRTVGFTPYTPSTSRPITTTSYCGYSCTYSSASRTGTIVGATLGSIFLIAIFAGVCAHYQKQKNQRYPRAIPVPAARGPHVPPPPPHQYPMHHVNQQVAPGPYVIPRPGPFVHAVEEAPPSYSSAITFHKQ